NEDVSIGITRRLLSFDEPLRSQAILGSALMQSFALSEGGYIWFINFTEINNPGVIQNYWNEYVQNYTDAHTPYIVAVTRYADQQTTFDRVREVFSIPNHIPVVLCNPNNLESVNQVVRVYWQHILNHSELDAQQREDIGKIIERFRP
ncbi:MAG: hypothetical protein AAF125_17675, partial [Chloroflexota bacterium]